MARRTAPPPPHPPPAHPSEGIWPFSSPMIRSLLQTLFGDAIVNPAQYVQRETGASSTSSPGGYATTAVHDETEELRVCKSDLQVQEAKVTALESQIQRLRVEARAAKHKKDERTARAKVREIVRKEASLKRERGILANMDVMFDTISQAKESVDAHASMQNMTRVMKKHAKSMPNVEEVEDMYADVSMIRDQVEQVSGEMAAPIDADRLAMDNEEINAMLAEIDRELLQEEEEEEAEAAVEAEEEIKAINPYGSTAAAAAPFVRTMSNVQYEQMLERACASTSLPS